jgi:hypothetical protein
MEGKLIKTKNLYALKVDDIIATNDDYFSTKVEHTYRLSTKNCEAIENGYDLEELARNYVDEQPNDFLYTTDEYWNAQVDFKKGFQKAMELMDKKYSEGIVEENFQGLRACIDDKDIAEFYINMAKMMFTELQQTEWDVEIEMICPHPEDTYVCGMQYGCDGDGCNHPNQIPYLDKNGCLILKRI